MAEVTGFERVWNSTLGVPQQVFLRTLRAAQSEDVDLFSHRGLLDFSLIPVAGIWDKGEAREDVGFEEAFDLTLGKMGVKKNWATEFAANIVTDPTMLLTGGITGMAKGARAAQKALRITEVNAALEATGKFSPSVGDLSKAVDDVLAGKFGKVTGKRRSLLQRAKKHIEKEVKDKGMGVHDLAARGGDQELRFGLPSMVGRGALQYRIPEYKSWVKFAKDKTPGMGFAFGYLKPIWDTAGRPLQKPMKDLAAKWGAVRDGIGTAHLNFATAHVGRYMDDASHVALDGTNKRIYEKIADTDAAADIFATEFKRHGNAARAASKSLGFASDIDGAWKNKFDDIWADLHNGKQPIYDKSKATEGPAAWFKGQLETFRKNYEATTGRFRGLQEEAGHIMSKAGEARKAAIATGNVGLFNLARGARKKVRKLFTTDVTAEGAIEAERTYRTVSAKAQDSMAEIIGQYASIKAQVVKDTGIDEKMLDLATLTAMEGAAPVAELNYAVKLAEMNPGDPKIARSFEELALRQLGAVDGAIGYLRDFTDNPHARQMLGMLEKIKARGVFGRDIHAIWDSFAFTPDLVRPDLYKAATNVSGAEILADGNRLISGKPRGKYLSFIDTPRLREIAKGIEANLEAGKAAPFDEVFTAELMHEFPEIRDIWKKSGRTAPQFAADVTGLRGAKEIEAKLAQFQQEAAAQAVSRAQDVLSAQAAEKAAGETVQSAAQAHKNLLARGQKDMAQAQEVKAMIEEGQSHAVQQLESARSAKAVAKRLRDRAARALEGKKTRTQGKVGKGPEDVSKVESTEAPLVTNKVDPQDQFDIAATKFRAWEEEEKRVLKDLKDWAAKKEELDRVLLTWGNLLGEAESVAGGTLKAARATAKETQAAMAKIVAKSDKLAVKWESTLAKLKTSLETETEATRARLGISQPEMSTLMRRQEEMARRFGFEGYHEDLRNINSVLARRARGETKFTPQPRARTIQVPRSERAIDDLYIDPTTDELLEEAGVSFEEVATRLTRLGLPRGETSDMVEGTLGLMVTAKEMQRHARDFPGQPLPPTLLDAARGYAMKSSAAIEEAMMGALGKAGKDYLRAMRYLAGQVHATSAAMGAIVPGSPLAYVGHIMTREQRKVLEAAFGEEGIGTLLDKGAPRTAAAMKRRLDSLTLSELNALHRSTKDPKVLAMLDELAKGMGYEAGFKQFEDAPLLALTTRLSQNFRHANASDFIRGLEKAGQVTLGRVRQVVQAGDQITVGKVRKFERTGGKDKEEIYRVGEEALTRSEVEGLVIEADNGELLFVPVSMLDAGMTMLDMGKPNLNGLVDIYDDTVTLPDSASAFGLRTMRGTIQESDFVRGGRDTVDAIRNRLVDKNGVGSFIALGDEEVITSAVSAIQNQWKAPGAMLAVTDTVDYFLRSMATVARPGFIVGNQASYIAQTSILVKNPKSIFGGYADSARFFASDNKLNAVYDPVMAAMAEPGQFKVGFDPISVGRRGPKDPDAATLAKYGLVADDLVFRLGDGTEMTRGEILRAINDVMVSHTREGLRGTARVSETAHQIAEAGAKRTSKRGQTWEGVKKFVEGSEGLPRLATVFAQVREGVPLKEAVENALMVHVNYADLTQFERQFVKRVMGFYTFFRKITPVAFEELSKNPAHAAMLAQLSKESGMFREEGGKTKLQAGPVTVNIDRLNPLMEAMHLTRYASQVFGEVGGQREFTAQNALTGRQFGPLQPGPSLEAGIQGFMATKREGAGAGVAAVAGEYASWLWPVRMAMDYGDGKEETSALDTFWSNLVPAQANNPVYRREMLRKRYKSAISELRQKYEQAKTESDRRAYQAEAARLEATATRLISNIK